MQETYHKPVGLEGEALKDAVAKAKAQEDAIYLIFKHTQKAYTASQITELTVKARRKWPLWSNRRALTNLTKEKAGKRLVKLPQMKIGPQGRPEHFYALNASTQS
jgi:hypothetical protein